MAKVMKKRPDGQSGSGLGGFPNPTHDKVIRKRPDRQGGSRLKGSPGSAQASTPETKICLLYYTLLTLTEDIPDDLSLEN